MGLLFGSLLGGFIGDKFGRKMANFLALAAIVPFTIGAGHVHSYEGSINIMNPNFISPCTMLKKHPVLILHSEKQIRFIQMASNQTHNEYATVTNIRLHWTVHVQHIAE